MLVSVIIPCYNAEKFINETLQSVVNQTFTDWEILIVDDGSTDNSAMMIQSFQDCRIKYIYQSNAGVSTARNVAIRQAQSKYLAFLDADDLFLPENLTKKIAFLEQNPTISLVHAAEIRFDPAKGVDLEIVSGKSGNVLYDLLEMRGNVIHSPSSVLVRKEAVEEVGLFDEHLSVSSDWELWVRLAQKYTFGYLPEPLTRYRLHDEQMHNDINKMEKDVLYAMQKMKGKDFFKNKAHFHYCLSNFHLILGACYLGDDDNYPQFIKHLFQSVFISPRPFWNRLEGRSRKLEE